MDRLGVDCPVALAVSLHAPNDALRDDLVPLNRKYPIAELMAACKRYLAYAPRDFITFEYCMLDGVNDSPAHAAQLVALVNSRRAKGVVQVQPHTLQPLSCIGAVAIVVSKGFCICENSERCRHCDHGSQDPWRRH